MKDRLGNEVPAEAEPFARFVAERGWEYLREWVSPGEYEDADGRMVRYEGFWDEWIWQEKPPAWPREEGVWHYQLSVGSATLSSTEAHWQRLIDLANEASENDRIACKVTADFDSPDFAAGWKFAP